jgi:hypothetical protein
MTNEGKWYIGGGLSLCALLLVIWLWSIILWIGIGCAAVALIILGARFWARAYHGWMDTRQRKAEVEEAWADVERARGKAEQQRALADQARAQAAALWNQTRMIPETMVGIVLDHPAQRERVMVWPRTTTNNYGLESPVVDALAEGPPQRAPIFAASERDMVSPQLLLGYGANGLPLIAQKEALRSGMIVLGRPGEGKTTIGRYWAALSLKYRFPVMVLDPHGGLLGDLAERFYTESDALTTAMMAADIAWVLDHRIELGGKYPHKFLLIIVDEWGYYAKRCPALVDALGRW